jgi:hypothetical protein
MGIPFKDLMELCGGVWKGRKLKAVIPGGSSCMVVPAEIMWNTNMDYDSLKKAGSSFGTGAVIVMDETTCMVRALERLARFYMSESCGQCTPCREGTGWLDRMLKRIIAGEGRSEDLGLLVDVANRIEGAHHARSAMRPRGRCRALKHFRPDFQYMIAQGPLDHGGATHLDRPSGRRGLNVWQTTRSISKSTAYLKARKGQMIMQVTDPPTFTFRGFCYHDKLSIAANCRMCPVEVEKRRSRCRPAPRR